MVDYGAPCGQKLYKWPQILLLKIGIWLARAFVLETSEGKMQLHVMDVLKINW